MEVVFRHSPASMKKSALPHFPTEQTREQLRKPIIKQTRGTKEWRQAIALETGSLREVGRTYGISADTVRRYRAEFARNVTSNGNGHHTPSETDRARSTARFLNRVITGADVLGKPDSV